MVVKKKGCTTTVRERETRDITSSVDVHLPQTHVTDGSERKGGGGGGWVLGRVSDVATGAKQGDAR